MYEIRPESVKTFIEDNNIKLPRFQRKQTWDDSKNFKLCISVFKQYPIGVSILSIENFENKTTRWLLDGRQRRNALIKMSEDPENIYTWAKKYIGFKESMQPHEVEDKFWQKINEYLELNEVDDPEEILDIEDDNSKIEEDKLSVEEPDSESVEKSSSKLTGLDLLLDLIILVHNKALKYSGFSKPFDFTKLIDNLPYVDTLGGGKQYLNSKKIKTFIHEFKSHCRNNNFDYEERESFLGFFMSRFKTTDDNDKKIKIEVDRNWPKIIDRIELIDKIDNLLLNSKIGLIEVKDISTADGQKIFNIINSEGTQLTAVEILSAKPSWTKQIKNPNPELVLAAKNLYSRIQIKNDNVVRWDIPATFIDRLEDSSYIFRKFSDAKTDFEKKLTLGFKLLSGLLVGGVKKEDITSLSLKNNINWELDFEKLIRELNLFTKILSEYEYFKYFKSWKGSILDILSDTIALNFIIISFKDWKRKGEPVGSNSNTRQFQKNSLILLDHLIFEYVHRQWRGSGDAKVAQNIFGFSSLPELFVPVEKNKWSHVLKTIFDENKIEENNINQKILEPILYHFYCLKKLAGPDTGLYSIEIDHIVPKTLFKNASTIPNKEILQNNLFNLALLPKDQNISKNNLKLNEISNQWLKDQIKKYEFIDEKDYDKFSNINNLNELKKLRRKQFEIVFDKDRDNFLN
jgi:hypothetical protein